MGDFLGDFLGDLLGDTGRRRMYSGGVTLVGGKVGLFDGLG